MDQSTLAVRPDGRAAPRIVTFLAVCLAGCAGKISPAPGEGGPETDSPVAEGQEPPSRVRSSPKSDDPSGPGAQIWAPAPGTSWQWQLTGAIDLEVNAEAFDVDLFEATDETLAALAGEGRAVICYFSAGSYEGWREDAEQFPDAVLGEPLEGWPDERWLDIRSPAVREIMRGRLDYAAARGCDAVEPDNVDGYANASGFALTYDDQLAYNRFLAAEAHARDLSIGLKNDLEQVPDLVAYFDWALNEECMQYEECSDLTPFVESGKAVFHVEYGGAELADEVCPHTGGLGFDSLIKRLDLDAWRVACP